MAGIQLGLFKCIASADTFAYNGNPAYFDNILDRCFYTVNTASYDQSSVLVMPPNFNWSCDVLSTGVMGILVCFSDELSNAQLPGTDQWNLLCGSSNYAP